MDETQTQLEAQHSPDGFNTGINEGEAGGQTVTHLHIHLIPRYAGDDALLSSTSAGGASDP